MLQHKFPDVKKHFAIFSFMMMCIALYLFWVMLVLLNRFYPERDDVSACEGRIAPHEPNRPIPRFVVNLIYRSVAVAIPLVGVLCFMFFGFFSYLFVRLVVSLVLNGKPDGDHFLFF